MVTYIGINSHPYSSTWEKGLEFDYEFDLKSKKGKVIIKGEGFIELTSLIGRKINALLDSTRRDKYAHRQRSSNCVFTANYLSGLQNQISRGLGVNARWDVESYNEDGSIKGVQYESLDEVVDELGDNIVCRFDSNRDKGKKLCHVVTVLGRLENGRIIGFEQRSWGANWGFCDVEECFKFYEAKDCYYEVIEEQNL